MQTFYLTTPIYYPNARPHVGSAYTTIVCDVLARYKRMCGYDVAFLTGTDEHGEKLERAAAAAGKSPSEFVAEKRELFVDLWEKLGIKVSKYPETKTDALRFICTEHPDHVTSVQRLLIRARENGYIYTQRYEGRYCIYDERYVSDSTEPANCDICGRPAELISEENYFFKLSAFQGRLQELYEKHPEFVQPDYRRNEVTSFVKSGLRDISVSRQRLKWGIPWPGDPNQVFYVWYDALTSYMTGIGYAQGDDGSPEFKKYWRNKPGEAEIVHMIGKDILRFHAVYWPAFIMAAYPDQPEMLPTTIFAHGWIYYDQDKMSKSKGNVVYPEPIVEALDSFDAPGNDALRYYLLREAPFGQDMSFSYDGLIHRFNSDLANDLGNLANRTVTMLDRYFESRLLTAEDLGEEQEAEREIRELAAGTLEAYCACFDRFDLSCSLESVWHFIGRVNKYLVEQQPWAILASNQDASLPAEPLFRSASAEGIAAKRKRLGAILYTATEAVRFAVVLLYPVLPSALQRLWKQLGCEDSLGNIEDQRFDDLKWGQLRPGAKVGKPEPIFPRLDKAKTLAKLHELAEIDRERDQPKEASKPVESETVAPGFSPAPPKTPESTPGPSASSQPPAPDLPAKITIDDFAKVEMRVGEVLAAEPIPGAKKLLKLQVDIGTEVRQVCAGIAEHYKPEDLIGMKVVIVANLAPRKLRGVESNGMILAASVGNGDKPVLVTFKEEVPKGARLK